MNEPSSEPSVLVEEFHLGPEGREADASALAVLVTLSRPASLNAIDWEMLRQLHSVIDGVGRRDDVCCMLLTGAGRAFSAGGDLKSYVALQRDPSAFPRFVADIHRVFGSLRDLPFPVVALVNGVTAAGGLELLLNCDFALMARSARVSDGHLNFGQMGGGGVLTLLPRVIGLQRASELIFSGRSISAEEAVEWGLAVRCVDDEALLESGLTFAREVATKSPSPWPTPKRSSKAYGLPTGISRVGSASKESETPTTASRRKTHPRDWRPFSRSAGRAFRAGDHDRPRRQRGRDRS